MCETQDDGRGMPDVRGVPSAMRQREEWGRMGGLAAKAARDAMTDEGRAATAAGKGVLDRRATAAWRTRKARVRPGKAKLGKARRLARQVELGNRKAVCLAIHKGANDHFRAIRRWKD